MTCMVTKRMGQSPHEDHWSVRAAAADAVAAICVQFGDKYVDLQARICKQLAKALTDLSKPATSSFGETPAGCLEPLGRINLDFAQ